MIRTEIININGQDLIKTYSDKGYYIERENIKYSEAIDPIGLDRIYVETDEIIEEEELLEIEEVEETWE